jgi:hypothetical protein
MSGGAVELPSSTNETRNHRKQDEKEQHTTALAESSHARGHEESSMDSI